MDKLSLFTEDIVLLLNWVTSCFYCDYCSCHKAKLVWTGDLPADKKSTGNCKVYLRETRKISNLHRLFEVHELFSILVPTRAAAIFHPPVYLVRTTPGRIFPRKSVESAYIHSNPTLYGSNKAKQKSNVQTTHNSNWFTPGRGRKMAPRASSEFFQETRVNYPGNRTDLLLMFSHKYLPYLYGNGSSRLRRVNRTGASAGRRSGERVNKHVGSSGRKRLVPVTVKSWMREEVLSLVKMAAVEWEQISPLRITRSSPNRRRFWPVSKRAETSMRGWKIGWFWHRKLGETQNVRTRTLHDELTKDRRHQQAVLQTVRRGIQRCLQSPTKLTQPNLTCGIWRALFNFEECNFTIQHTRSVLSTERVQKDLGIRIVSERITLHYQSLQRILYFLLCILYIHNQSHN